MGTWARTAAAGVATVVVAGLLAWAPAANAITNGEIKGTVTNGSSGVSGVKVKLYQDGELLADKGVSTSSNGSYRITGLSDATYRVCFEPAKPLLAECWSDSRYVDWAQDVPIGSATPTQQVNESLAKESTVAGRVTDAAGQGLAGARVQLMWQPEPGDPWWQPEHMATTDSQGNYKMTGVYASADYRVRVSSPTEAFGATHLPGVAALTDATPVAVGAAESVTGLDVRVPQQHTISGKALNNGQPVSGAIVRVMPVSAGGAVPLLLEPTAAPRANAAGDFAASVGPGTYVLYSMVPSTDLRGWWGDAIGPEDAQRAVVADAPVAGVVIDFTAADGGFVRPPAPTTPTTPVEPVPTPAPGTRISVLTAPSLNGSARVGGRLRVRVGTYSPAQVSTSVRWYVGGKKVRKGTRPSLRLTRAMRGSKVRVKVRVTSPGAPTLVVWTRAKRIR